MNLLAQSQLQLNNDLWHALDNDELRLFYQPKYCAPHGPILGFEALLRWQHPQHGLLSPDRFLPIAEKTGMIVNIGDGSLTKPVASCISGTCRAIRRGQSRSTCRRCSLSKAI